MNSFKMLAKIIAQLRLVDVQKQGHIGLGFAAAASELADAGYDTESFDFANFSSTENFLCLIYSLIDQCELLVASATYLEASERDLARSYVDRVKEAMVASQKGNQWQHFVAHSLSNDLVGGLRLTGTLFRTSGQSIKLIDAEVSDSLNELRDLIASIELMSLPDKIKGSILGQLLKIEYILRTYTVFGPQDLELRLKAAIGEVVVNSSELTPEQRENLAPAFGWIGSMLTKYEKFGKLAKTTEYLVKLISAGS